MSESNFDRIAEDYDDSLPAHVVDHYLEKRARFVIEHCPRGSALDVGCGTGALAARLADAGYEMVGVDPSEGMLRVLEQRTSKVRGGPWVGHVAGVPGRELRPRLLRGGHAPHRRARRRAADAVRDGARDEARRTGPRLGSQSAQSLLAAPDGACAPGHGRGEAGRRATSCFAVWRMPARSPFSSRSSGMVPDFTPRSLLGAAAAAERAVERTPLVRGICAHNVVLASKASALSA